MSAVAPYQTIVIDPPWPMKKIKRRVRPNQVEFDYPVMKEAELRAFAETMKSMAADDCHLFMWTTQKFLPLALELVGVYGFAYSSIIVWRKNGGFQPYGLPQFNHEPAIYARKGSPSLTMAGKGLIDEVDSLTFYAKRREHSRKPDEFYNFVRSVTEAPRIDVFSREKREGFDQFGNEIDKFSGRAS